MDNAHQYIARSGASSLCNWIVLWTTDNFKRKSSWMSICVFYIWRRYIYPMWLGWHSVKGWLERLDRLVLYIALNSKSNLPVIGCFHCKMLTHAHVLPKVMKFFSRFRCAVSKLWTPNSDIIIVIIGIVNYCRKHNPVYMKCGRTICKYVDAAGGERKRQLQWKHVASERASEQVNKQQRRAWERAREPTA